MEAPVTVLGYRRLEASAACDCGATLLGLELTQRCPGCGRLVAEMPWRLIWNGQRHWLRTVRDGLVWLTFGHMMMWVMMVVLLAAINQVEAEPPRVLRLLPDLAIVAGAWLGATGNPMGERKREALAGSLVRVLAVSYGAVCLIVSLWAGEMAWGEIWIWWYLLQVACWAGLMMALAWRAVQMARQMEHSLLWIYAQIALVMAGAGAVMANLLWVVHVLGAPAPGTTVSKLLNEAVTVGGMWDFWGRSVLFCIAVWFWGQINMALAGYQRTQGVRYTPTGMKLDEVNGRSLWGKLRVQAGESGAG